MKYNKKLFSTYFIYFVVLLLFCVIRILSSKGMFSFITNDAWQNNVATIVVQVLIMGLIPIMLYTLFNKKNVKQTFADFGFKKVNFKVVLLCILIGLCVYILNIFVASIFNGVLSFFGYKFPTGSAGETETSLTFVNFLFSTFFVAVLPAIFEEITHRGLLLRGIANEKGYKKAIIISSIMFGLMHLNVGQFFYATLIGVVIGFVSSFTGSIIPAMILHFMNNFLNVYVSFATTNNWFGGKIISGISKFLTSSNVVQSILTLIILLAVISVCLVVLIMKLFKETRYKEISSSIVNVATALNNTDEESLTEEQITTTFMDYIVPYFKNYTIIDIMLPKTKNEEPHFNLLSSLFAVCSWFLGGIITFFTFLWGVLWLR